MLVILTGRATAFVFTARGVDRIKAGCALDFLTRFCASQTAHTPPIKPTPRMTTPAISHFRLRAMLAAASTGISILSSVSHPQCGHGAVIPTPSAGNSMWPPQWEHWHLRYFVSATGMLCRRPVHVFNREKRAMPEFIAGP